MVGTHEAIECRGLRIQISGSGPLHKLISEVMLQFVHTTKTDLTVSVKLPLSRGQWDAMECHPYELPLGLFRVLFERFAMLRQMLPHIPCSRVCGCITYIDLLSRPALPRKLGSCK